MSMDIRLKERLVGALVLVFAAVVFIPMVLDGPGGGRQVTQDVPLPDVSEAPERRTVRIALDAPTATDATALEAAAQPGASMEEAEPAAVDLTPSQRDAVVAEQQPEIPVTRSTRVAAADKETAPAARQEPPSQAESMPWTIQAGSFSRNDNAEGLAAKLREMGYAAYVSRFADGSRVHYRVRIGGFATREEADRNAAEIRAKTGGPARTVPAS